MSFRRTLSMAMEGKTVLVTGSTDGIGKHTATRLAQDGATVLIHGRNQQRTQQAAEDIKAATRNNNVQAYTADLSSLKQVCQLADQVKQDHDSIDVLINNAGVFESQKRLSEDGYEMTWAVNVLAPFLLTSLLLPKIKDRIINVSSISAGSTIDWHNLNAEKRFSGDDAYGLSKLAMMMFTYALADRLKDSGVTVNTLDPGTVDTKLLQEGWAGCYGIPIKSANDEHFLATDPSLAETTGAYFVGQRNRQSPRMSYDKSAQQRLWGILEQQTGAKYE